MIQRNIKAAVYSLLSIVLLWSCAEEQTPLTEKIPSQIIERQYTTMNDFNNNSPANTNTYSFSYNNNNLIETVIVNSGSNNKTVNFFYDSEGRITEIKDLEKSTFFSYGSGQIERTVSISDDVFNYITDSDDKIMKLERINSSGTVIESWDFIYQNENLIEVKDKLNNNFSQVKYGGYSNQKNPLYNFQRFVRRSINNNYEFSNLTNSKNLPSTYFIGEVEYTIISELDEDGFLTKSTIKKVENTINSLFAVVETTIVY